MNKSLLIILFLSMIFIVSVSALSEITIIGGTIYTDKYATVKVANATIIMSCLTYNDTIITKVGMSGNTGKYTFFLEGNELCGYKKPFSITAIKDGLYKTRYGIISQRTNTSLCVTNIGLLSSYIN